MNEINKNEKKNNNKKKTRDEEIKETLIDLEKDLNNFRLDIDQKDKTIKECDRLYRLLKISIEK